MTLTTDRTQPESQSRIGDLAREHPWFVAASAIAFVSAAVYLLKSVFRMSADEEAPIRVRNGSLAFLIADPRHRWERFDRRSWRIRDKGRPSNLFDLEVVPRPGASCSGPLHVRARIIRIKYTTHPDVGVETEHVFMLRTPSNFTIVEPDHDELADVGALLLFSPKGYISEIAAGQSEHHLSVVCSFANDQQLKEMWILNP